MSRNLPLPLMPSPPKEYRQSYFQELVRSFTTYMRAERNPGEGRHTNLVLTALQTDDQGLEVGALFEQDGFVKVTRANNPHLAGASAAVEVGSVTVSIV